MYDYRYLSLFWQSIRPIQGTTKFAVQFNGQTIIPQDFDFIQKEGTAYIYDKIKDCSYEEIYRYTFCPSTLCGICTGELRL